MSDYEKNNETESLTRVGKKRIRRGTTRRELLRLLALGGAAILLAACDQNPNVGTEGYEPKEVKADIPIDWNHYEQREIMEGLNLEKITLNNCEITFLETEHGPEDMENAVKISQIDKLVKGADVLALEYFPDEMKKWINDNPLFEWRGQPEKRIYPFFEKMTELGVNNEKPLLITDPVNNHGWVSMARQFITGDTPDNFNNTDGDLDRMREKENIYRNEVNAALLSEFTKAVSGNPVKIVYVLPKAHAEQILNEFRQSGDSTVSLDYAVKVAPETDLVEGKIMRVREEQFTGRLYVVDRGTGKYKLRNSFRIQP